MDLLCLMCKFTGCAVSILDDTQASKQQPLLVPQGSIIQDFVLLRNETGAYRLFNAPPHSQIILYF